MASAHANVNGILSPPSQHVSANDPMALSAKRKRDDTNEIHHHANGLSIPKAADLPTTASTDDVQSRIRDLIDILKGYDTEPSILSRPLLPHTSPTDPQPKRQKSEDADNTVAERAAARLYQSLDDVLEDVDRAILDIEDKMQLANPSSRTQFMPATDAQSELGLKITAFSKRAHQLVGLDKAFRDQKKASKTSGPSNGYGTSTSTPATQLNTGAGDNKLVLTLYGTAPTPKQLFSSFQIPTLVGDKDVIPPLREAGLPTGITTTKIFAVQSSTLVEQSKKATLGEVFPSPANLLPLLPPKPSKHSTTRSSTVGWYQPSPADPFSRNSGYARAQITCGQWLDYSNASPPQSSKKRQRDRAMSLGGGKAQVPELSSAESEASKQEALFRSAYSSFAPTKDDSAAVATTGILERMWWQQSGERQFERLVDSVANLDDDVSADPDKSSAVDATEELKSFEDAVERFEKETVDPSLVNILPGPEKSVEEKDVEEILEGISELLDTLNSYQRIRHMSLNTSIRPSGLLSTPVTLSLGTPSKPSDQEQSTYEILKSQLTLMIAGLPPYAVSKLDPDRLADLRVSTKIEVEVDDSRGVMEEDETASKARAAAAASSSASAVRVPATVHRSNPAAVYGNQYSAPRPQPAATNQYYGANQTPVRAPQSVQRAPSTAPAPYAVQRAAGATPFRPSQGYSNTPNYGQAAPRPVQQYSSSGQMPYASTPVNQSYMRSAGNQGYQNTPQPAPQAAMTGRYPSQTAYPHQAQTAQNGHTYGMTGYNAAQNIARQNPAQSPMYTPQASHVQARANYSTPTAPVQQPSRQYLQAPGMNGGTAQQPQATYNQQQTPTGYNSSFLSTQEQSNMIERQRAHMQAQQAANQQQARESAQSMGTPTAGQMNGINPVAAGR